MILEIIVLLYYKMTTNYSYNHNTDIYNKTKYFLTQSHGIVKSYYFTDSCEKNYVNNGVMKNVSIIKINDCLFGLVNLKDIMLRSIREEEIIYNNIEIENYFNINKLKVNKNQNDGITFISMKKYSSKRSNFEYIIISTHYSLEVYKIITNISLEKVYSYCFSYHDTSRKFDIYNEYLYSTSKNGLTVFSLQDIDNNYIGTDIKVDFSLDVIGNTSLSGLTIDSHKGLLYLHDISSNISIFSLAPEHTPKYLNRFDSPSICDSMFITFTHNQQILYGAPSLTNGNSNVYTDKYYLILSVGNCGYYIVDATNINSIIKTGIDTGYSNTKANQIIHIKENIFIGVDYKQSLNSKTPYLQVYNFIYNETGIPSLKFIEEIKLEGVSHIGKIYYDNDILYHIGRTNGLVSYKLEHSYNKILLTKLNSIDSFMYYKNLDSKGAYDLIYNCEKYKYLLDSENGLIIYSESLGKNNTKNVKLNDKTDVINDYYYQIYPDKLFVHMNLLANIDCCKTDLIDFESKLLAYNTELNIGLIYIPYYILQSAKPYTFENINNCKTLENYSYGLDLNICDAKPCMETISIINYNSNIYTPIYTQNSLIASNNNKYGPLINTHSLNLSGSFIINDYFNLMSFVLGNSSNGLDLNIAKNFYDKYVEYQLNNSLIIYFNKFGISTSDTFIVKDNVKGCNDIIYYEVGDRYSILVHKTSFPNICLNNIYKVLDNCNNIIGFTRFRDFDSVKNLANNVLPTFFNDTYLYMEPFYTDELTLQQGVYSNINNKILSGNIKFIKEPIMYTNKLFINNSISKLEIPSYHLNIDVLNIELLNPCDFKFIIDNFLLKSIVNKTYNISNFEDYKNNFGTGFLITTISEQFININSNKLQLGDIICEIEDSSYISSKIVFNNGKTNNILNVKFYRLDPADNKWKQYTHQINTILYKESSTNNIL